MHDGTSAECLGAIADLGRGQHAAGKFETLKPGARVARSVTWALYPLLAVAYILALRATMGGIGRFAILEAIYLLPIVGCIVLASAAARSSQAGERRYWVLIAVANAVLGICELMLLWWLAFISPAGPPPVAWPFQIAHVVAAGCFVVLMIQMSRLPSESLGTRVRVGFDAGALGLITYAAVLVFYARPVMAGSHAPVGAVLVGSGYTLVALLMMFGTLGNIVGFKMVKWRSWETLGAVAIGIYSFAIAMWPLWYTTVVGSSRNMERGLLDLIQFSGHFLLMAAAVYRLTESDAWDLRPLALPAVFRRRWLGAILPALSICASVVLGWAALSARNDPVWFAVLGGLALATTVVVLARSLLLALEHGQLFIEASTDPLTGLFNHRHFQEQLGVELDHAARYAEALAVAVFDLDDFGEFNERFGHLEGDRLLAGLGSRLGALVEGNSMIARLGGDEFAILLPGHDARGASVFAQHVLDVIGVECGVNPGELSASAGVAAFPEHSGDPAELLLLADGALFNAKETGKGRVVVYDPARVPDLSARERIERLERNSRIAAVRALAAAVDARDPDSRFRAQRVAALVVRLASYLELPEERIRSLELLAMVHDVGHIAVPDAVLKKQGSLKPADWADIRTHPEQGQRILASIGLTELVPGVRSHHERWDGAGYPDGLVGKEIPFEARLLALCDAYEAMTSSAQAGTRPTLSDEAARAEIAAGAGTQFDPGLAEDLLGMLDVEASRPCAVQEVETNDVIGAAGVRTWTPVGGLEAQRV